MDLRKVEILHGSKLSWHEITFKHLKKGDIFRMFESTGEPVQGTNGETEFVATSDAYIGHKDIWTINTTEYIAREYKINKDLEAMDRFEEFKQLAEQMHQWLVNNCNPHTIIIIDYDGSTVFEGTLGIPMGD